MVSSRRLFVFNFYFFKDIIEFIGKVKKYFFNLINLLKGRKGRESPSTNI